MGYVWHLVCVCGGESWRLLQGHKCSLSSGLGLQQHWNIGLDYALNALLKYRLGCRGLYLSWNMLHQQKWTTFCKSSAYLFWMIIIDSKWCMVRMHFHISQHRTDYWTSFLQRWTNRVSDYWCGWHWLFMSTRSGQGTAIAKPNHCSQRFHCLLPGRDDAHRRMLSKEVSFGLTIHTAASKYCCF